MLCTTQEVKMKATTVGMLSLIGLLLPLLLACSGASESESESESKSMASWTKEAIPAAFLVPDDFPDGWTVKRNAEALTIEGTHA